MKGTEIVMNALQEFKENELITVSKLYKEKLSGKITEAAYYKTLQRLCESGELVKIAKGTYHLPKIGKYGIVPPSEREIISAFTDNETGTVVGYSLYNQLNLSTQISKNITVMSSVLDSFTKSIRNIVVHQVPLRFSDEIKNMLSGLEVLQNFSTIQDISIEAFLSYAKELSLSYNPEAFEKVITARKYKKSTISFMKEVLDYHGTENNLSQHLSALSDYKHPKMEELYEFARVS